MDKYEQYGFKRIIKMAKYEWSEVFMSIEGEGPEAGKPTAYVRFARCNFTCGKFNNPNNIVDNNGYAPLTFNPAHITSINDFGPMEIGCDTQYAVNPKFAHIWHKGTEDDLANEIMQVVPHRSWIHPETKQPVILSLTGGEPTLKWKTIPALLNHSLLEDLQTVLIETNCSVPFKNEFIHELNDWQRHGHNRKVIWSNSPKLSASGENWKQAIVPEIALRQRNATNCNQYFKFVCGPSNVDFDEVRKAMKEYYAGGIPTSVPVLIMPESCTEQQQNNIAAKVADMCIEQGYTYCHRVHNSVYANAIGK